MHRQQPGSAARRAAGISAPQVMQSNTAARAGALCWRMPNSSSRASVSTARSISSMPADHFVAGVEANSIAVFLLLPLELPSQKLATWVAIAASVPSSTLASASDCCGITEFNTT